jgi:hypothetical protein
MRTKMKKRKRTKSGSRAATLLAGCGLLLCAAVHAAESYSVVAGSVFREPGFALPGAEVTLTPDAETVPKRKPHKLTFTTNTRGEFAFRVPAAPARYMISAAAKGYKSQQKEVETRPEERIDVTFTLAAESNK